MSGMLGSAFAGLASGLGTGLMEVGKQEMKNAFELEKEEAIKKRELNLAQKKSDLEKENQIAKEERDKIAKGNEIVPDVMIGGKSFVTRNELDAQNAINKRAEPSLDKQKRLKDFEDGWETVEVNDKDDEKTDDETQEYNAGKAEIGNLTQEDLDLIKQYRPIESAKAIQAEKKLEQQKWAKEMTDKYHEAEIKLKDQQIAINKMLADAKIARSAQGNSDANKHEQLEILKEQRKGASATIEAGKAMLQRDPEEGKKLIAEGTQKLQQVDFILKGNDPKKIVPQEEYAADLQSEYARALYNVTGGKTPTQQQKQQAIQAATTLVNSKWRLKGFTFDPTLNRF